MNYISVRTKELNTSYVMDIGTPDDCSHLVTHTQYLQRQIPPPFHNYCKNYHEGQWLFPLQAVKKITFRRPFEEGKRLPVLY